MSKQSCWTTITKTTWFLWRVVRVSEWGICTQYSSIIICTHTRPGAGVPVFVLQAFFIFSTDTIANLSTCKPAVRALYSVTKKLFEKITCLPSRGKKPKEKRKKILV